MQNLRQTPDHVLFVQLCKLFDRPGGYAPKFVNVTLMAILFALSHLVYTL
jgi:hypothetical protein